LGLIWPNAGAGAADTPPPSSDVIVLRRCPIEYERSSLLGSSLMGVLQEVSVRPGEEVKAGQVLGRLQDQDVRAEMELRAVEAESDVEIRIGEARYALAIGKLKTSETLNRRSFLSAEELKLHKLEADTRALEIEEAKHKKKIAQIQHRQVEAMVHAREFSAP